MNSNISDPSSLFRGGEVLKARLIILVWCHSAAWGFFNTIVCSHGYLHNSPLKYVICKADPDPIKLNAHYSLPLSEFIFFLFKYPPLKACGVIKFFLSKKSDQFSLSLRCESDLC